MNAMDLALSNAKQYRVMPYVLLTKYGTNDFGRFAPCAVAVAFRATPPLLRRRGHTLCTFGCSAASLHRVLLCHISPLRERRVYRSTRLYTDGSATCASSQD